MKTMKTSILSAASLVAMIAGAAVAGMAPGTGIVDSPHDMNAVNGLSDDTQGRVCAFCHTPHHALTDPTGVQQPLWSHSFTETANYRPYASPTLQAAIGTDPLYGPSRLCMSCHDGVIAADQHYGGRQAGTNARLDNDRWSGVAIGMRDANGVGDLSNDHPIGFVYKNVSDVDTGIFPAAGRTFKGNNHTQITIEEVLTDGYMTCATCHDVHNKDNASNASGANYFLYSPQEGSQLCLTCHVKGDESRK